MTDQQNSSALLDPAKPEHAKSQLKLENDLIAWFTTVSEHGVPHSVPVWFLWRDGKVYVFSEPDAVKTKHVRHGSPVLLHLEAGRFGDDVTVLNGTAELSDRDTTAWLDEIGDDYATKYEEGMSESGVSGIRDVAAKFSTVIIVTPTELMAW
jgi:PPOX class probable F420-dependent enzyme